MGYDIAPLLNNIKKIFISTVHLDLKPICCPFCGKTFMVGHRYNTHLTRHRERTLKCNQCDKSFNRRMSLIMHLKFHLNPKVKPYKCKKCGYGNDRKGNIHDHINKVHKIKWSNDDILVDKEEEAWMLRTLKEQADKIQGYVNGQRINQNKERYKKKKDNISVEKWLLDK